ncbi:MAG: dipeptidase [Pseudomonadota bacterium]
MRIFDGHNDILSQLQREGQGITPFLEGRAGHIDALKCRESGMVGGLFAVYVPSPSPGGSFLEQLQAPSYDLALPEPIPWREALPVALEQVALALKLEAAGAVRLCTSVAEIETTVADGSLALVLHMEGADALDPELHMLDVLYASGLRSLGLVWSRNTIFAQGVPFRYPSGPDIGAGLTDLGRDLVARCNGKRILVDLAHLNEAGFWDVADISTAPLVASHSNAHVLCPHARNLTDDQLAAIARSGGLVGLNFATAFLRQDGRMVDVDLAPMMAQLEHLIAHVGAEGVGLGSDFDGALVPSEIGSAAGLPVLVQAMETHGFAARQIEQICHLNWMRVLRDTWGG